MALRQPGSRRPTALPCLLCRVSAGMARHSTSSSAAPRWPPSRPRRASRCRRCPRWSTGVPTSPPRPAPGSSDYWTSTSTRAPACAAPPLRPDRPGVQRPGQPVGGGDPARGRGVGRQPRDRHHGLRCAARQRPAGQLDQHAGQPRHRRRDPGDLRADRDPAAAAARAGIPLVVVDPVNPPPPDLPSVGATNWAGRPGRHRAPARASATAGSARIGRAGGLPVQPGPGGRLPLRPGDGPGSASTRTWCGTATSTTRPASPAAASCSAWPTGRPRSSPAATSRRSGVYEAARAARPADPGRPERGRLRRPAGRPLGRARR